MAHADEMYHCRVCREKPGWIDWLARAVRNRVSRNANVPLAVRAHLFARIDQLLAASADVRPIFEETAVAEEENDDGDDDDADADDKLNFDADLLGDAARGLAVSGVEEPPTLPPTRDQFLQELQEAASIASSYDEGTRTRTFNFVESSIVAAELCTLCGGTNPHKRCAACADPVHWFCISPSTAIATGRGPLGAKRLLDNQHWRCMQCKICAHCNSGADDEHLIVCDW